MQPIMWHVYFESMGPETYHTELNALQAARAWARDCEAMLGNGYHMHGYFATVRPVLSDGGYGDKRKVYARTRI